MTAAQSVDQELQARVEKEAAKSKRNEVAITVSRNHWGDSHQFDDVLVSEQIDEVRNGRPGWHGDVRGAGCIVLQLLLATVCLELGEHMSNFIRAMRKILGVVAKTCNHLLLHFLGCTTPTNSMKA